MRISIGVLLLCIYNDDNNKEKKDDDNNDGAMTQISGSHSLRGERG